MTLQAKSYKIRASDIKPQWHVLDAQGKPLGRLSSEIAVLLMGKHRPTYLRHQNTGDFVVVVNAEKVRVTGKKVAQMMYYRHSGYPGGLREENMERVLAKNYLARDMLSRLKLVVGESSDKYKSQIVGAQRAAEKAAQAPIDTKPARTKAVRAPRKTEEKQPEAPIKLAKSRSAKAAEMKKAPAKKPKAEAKAPAKAEAKPKAAAKPRARGKKEEA
ncbi:MAG: 50S ribosomal protein L13 [SAR202 cluster bacterium]|nr:50S ribosomal protein L13 [SAR202 cluster bacterium]